MSAKPGITSLPLEIKQQIFAYHFKAEGGYVYDGKSDKLRNADGSPINLSLFYTCRSIANACKDLPLALNTIHFSTLFREDWRSLAGCFNLAATYYHILQQDLVLHLAHLITPEMHTQLEKDFPTFKSKLEAERDFHFRAWHTDGHLPSSSDNVASSEDVRPPRCEFVQLFYDLVISDSEYTQRRYCLSAYQSVDRLWLNSSKTIRDHRPGSVRSDLDPYDLYIFESWNSSSGEVHRCLSLCLRLIADKNPGEFANRVYASLPHWVDMFPAEEFFRLEFDYWAIPSPSQVANVLNLLGAPEFVWKIPDGWHYAGHFIYDVSYDHPANKLIEFLDNPTLDFSFRYREKPRFSAAAVAIRFLGTLPHQQRVHIRNITLHEDYPAVNNASLHPLGLVPFLKENSLLRVQRHVNVVHHFVECFGCRTGNVVDLLTGVAGTSQRYTFEEGFRLELGCWLLDALAVADAGISAGAFTLLLDAGRHADVCTSAFDVFVHHSIALYKAWSECVASNLVTPSQESYDDSNTSPTRLLMVNTRRFCVGEAFQSAIQQMMSQESTTLRCNFNLGQPEDHHTILNGMAAWHGDAWSYWVRGGVDLGRLAIDLADMEVNNRETLSQFREIQSRDEYLQSKSRE
ncbi:hypothetical protein ACHAPU_002258 [Fusarium lateritium]